MTHRRSYPPTATLSSFVNFWNAAPYRRRQGIILNQSSRSLSSLCSRDPEHQEPTLHFHPAVYRQLHRPEPFVA